MKALLNACGENRTWQANSALGQHWVAALWALPCAVRVLGHSLRIHLWSIQSPFTSSPCLWSLVWCWEIDWIEPLTPGDSLPQPRSCQFLFCFPIPKVAVLNGRCDSPSADKAEDGSHCATVFLFYSSQLQLLMTSVCSVLLCIIPKRT